MLDGLARRSVFWIGAACGAVWTSFAFAGVFAHTVTEAQISETAIGTAGVPPQTCPGCLATISSTGSVPSATFGPSQSDSLARAVADYGVLKNFATSTSSGHFGRAKATATASFSDLFTIDAAGLNGQHGTVVIPLELGYTVTRSGQGNGSVTLTFEPGGDPTRTYQRSLIFNSDGTTTSNSFDPGHVVVPFSPSILAAVDFVFGQPTSFVVQMESIAGGVFDASFTLDAEHSTFWGGFQSVTDANGRAVDYTLSPGSQVDWSTSFIPRMVPEPTTYALMLAGLWAIVCASRKKSIRA
jgi:PEP-CTERM motif